MGRNEFEGMGGGGMTGGKEWGAKCDMREKNVGKECGKDVGKDAHKQVECEI